MFGIILLLLVGAGAYVGWFHKFTLEDGTEVKGWVAKYKAEHNANPLDNPKEAFDDIVATVKEEGGKMKEERGKMEVESQKSKVESHEGMVANGSNRVPTEDNPSGLSITSHPLDFEEVLQEAEEDPFGKAWGLMSGYFGWLLLGASRHDWIDKDSIWITMSNGCKYFKDCLIAYYKEQDVKGELTEDDLWLKAAWVVNAHLNNAIGFFIERAEQYFAPEEWEEMGPRILAWYDAFYEERSHKKGTNITDEPNAAKWLAKLFTIFRGEDDSMMAYNEVEYFEVTSDFDIYLPQPKVQGGICER